MGGVRKPGPLCGAGGNLDDGTTCRDITPPPGPVGPVPHRNGATVHFASDWAVTELARAGPKAYGTPKALALDLLDLLPVKPGSPLSLALFRHYVKGSGEPYVLQDIPEPWQKWIERATKRRVGRFELSSYNSGLYDLRNSLGHFRVTVSAAPDGRLRIFRIDDVYQFGFRPNDVEWRGQHGFPLSHLSPESIARLRQFLPDIEYRNPGGFTETWEIVSTKKETVLHIPRQFLERVGVPFPVHGQFTR